LIFIKRVDREKRKSEWQIEYQRKINPRKLISLQQK